MTFAKFWEEQSEEFKANNKVVPLLMAYQAGRTYGFKVGKQSTLHKIRLAIFKLMERL